MASTLPARKTDKRNPGPDPTKEIGAADVNGLLDHVTGWENVKSHGAVGDGAADDTEAIQEAIDSLPVTGGKVYFPRGTYRVTSSIASTKPSLVLEGEGGAGWNAGAATRIETSAAIVVFDLGTASGSELRGAQIANLSINDTSGAGAALGAVLIRNQWNCVFRNVSVNSFTGGYAFNLDATGGAVVLTSFENVKGRQNKYGITVAGTVGQVTGTNVGPSTYFALSTPIAGSIGIEMQDGQMDGAVDTYETGVKLVGDGARVSGRLEGNALHVHIAGPTARRNVVSGARISSGGTVASVQIDNGANIFDNVVALNTYSAPAVGIVDNTVSPQNNYVYEPQQGNLFVRRHTTGTLRQEIRNSRNIASGDNAEYLASAANGAIKAVLRAVTATTNVVQFGSDTNQNVQIIRNGSAVITIGTNSTVEFAAATVGKRLGVTYGATVAIPANQANEFSTNANDGSAFTVAAPTNGVSGQRITIRIRNTSGGALGAVTWDAVYKLAAWTSPASGQSRSVDFTFDGTNWIETGRTPADVPN
jgi:hypothetical protein